MESTRQHTSDKSGEEKRPNAATTDSVVMPAAAYSCEVDMVRNQRHGAPPMSPGQVLSFQHSVGNGVVARAMNRRIQRHPEGKELPRAEEQIGEIENKAQAAPEATRTKDEATTQVADAKKSGEAFQKQNKLSPGAMSLANAQKVLQGSYGGVKTIVPGSIVILADQPACCAKYDEVCMADKIKRSDGTDWKKGDCAKDDAAAGVTTEGFAWKGIVYVNGKTTLVTATAHEILHNNVSAGFRGKVGETFNEGTTETLARNALTAAGVTVPAVTSYPDQVKLTAKLQGVVGLPVLCDAYFSDPDKLIKKFEELKGAGTWATLKGHAEALNVAEFDKAIAAKKAGTTK